MPDFQQFFDSFLCGLRDEKFLSLLSFLGMNLTTMLNYQEFCQMFQTRETEDVQPSLVPSHK